MFHLCLEIVLGTSLGDPESSFCYRGAPEAMLAQGRCLQAKGVSHQPRLWCLKGFPASQELEEKGRRRWVPCCGAHPWEMLKSNSGISGTAGSLEGMGWKRQLVLTSSSARPAPEGPEDPEKLLGSRVGCNLPTMQLTPALPKAFTDSAPLPCSAARTA